MSQPDVNKRSYPENEFIPVVEMVKGWPNLKYLTVLKWCRTGVYQHAKKIGGAWFVHPDQFRQWFASH